MNCFCRLYFTFQTTSIWLTYRINSKFLGLENTEDRTNVYDALFNSYGQPKTEVDASILIEDGGNLLEMLVPKGEFEGMMQPILRSKQINDLLL